MTMADENLESAADISEEQKREAVKQARSRSRSLRITMLQPLPALRMMTAQYVTARKAQSRGCAGAAAAAPEAAEEWGRVQAGHAAAAAAQERSDRGCS